MLFTLSRPKVDTLWTQVVGSDAVAIFPAEPTATYPSAAAETAPMLDAPKELGGNICVQTVPLADVATFPESPTATYSVSERLEVIPYIVLRTNEEPR
jgi:hypothetical protein